MTELLRPGAPSMFLLQQPRVHLHPSAQVAHGVGRLHGRGLQTLRAGSSGCWSTAPRFPHKRLRTKSSNKGTVKSISPQRGE